MQNPIRRLLPRPRQASQGSGAFELSDRPTLRAANGVPGEATQRLLAALAELDVRPRMGDLGATAPADLRLELGDEAGGAESYRLTIDPSLNREVPAPSVGAEPPAAAESGRPAGPPVIRRREGLRAKTPGRSGPDVRPSAREGPKTPAAQPGRVTLQVAAVKDGAVARKMVADLKAKGFDAYRSTATTGGQGTWHRVRVGRFADRQAAAATKRRLEGQGMAPIIVVD